ncbi:MAG: hypothetical protein R2819_02390 [Allomuricauda sp.]
MARDLRELFARERETQTHALKKGHDSRFLSKLEEKLPIEKPNRKQGLVFWLGVAASIVAVLGLGIYFLPGSKTIGPDANTNIVKEGNQEAQYRTISLGDLSPDLKKIENYYLTNINVQLSELEINATNKEIMDDFMEKLADLDTEYHRLNGELNELGPNDQTISALIKNLQLRLQLLQKLKTKLNQLKTSKNGQKSSHIV